MRLLPKSLAGQFTLLLLIALGIGQVVSLVLFVFESFENRRDAYQEGIVLRMATVARLLEGTPPELNQSVLEASSYKFARFWLTEEPVVIQADTGRRANDLSKAFSLALGINPNDVRVVFSQTRNYERNDGRNRNNDKEDHYDIDWFSLSAKLVDGSWLNLAVAPPSGVPVLGQAFLLTFVFSAIGIALVALLMGRWIASSIQRLSDAASRFGRGEVINDLPEQGPQEIRKTIRTFNRMRERLNRYVKDRTLMLAAVSHDLKTPITSLRLHAEFIDNKALQGKIIAAIDEMQEMTEDTLSFIREDTQIENTDIINLSALVESVAADLVELGHKIEVVESQPIFVRGRSSALRRAVSNLLMNAIEFGNKATVTTDIDNAYARITVEDDGVGIPESELERVFNPFVRLEGSRNRNTGGSGLGLSIVRSIARSHGGNAYLEAILGGGLRAIIKLPLENV